MTTGRQLQLEGVDANLAAADAPHRRNYLWHAELAMEHCIHTMVEFTAEDVRERIPEDITPHSHNVLPSLFSRASREGRICYVGPRHATRRSRHAGRNSVWTGSHRVDGAA